MNKPTMTVYVADSEFVPAEVLKKVVAKEGFAYSADTKRYEFLINVVGISNEKVLDESYIDFECLLDHITDLDIEQLTHEEIRTLDVGESYNYHVHSFVYYAPNSAIHARYVEREE